MQGRWIWYYGDFEIYHSLKMQVRREEYDYMFPPFWKLDDCYHNVKFRKEAILNKKEEITIYAHGIGMAEIDGKRYAFNESIGLNEGKHKIIIYVANINGLPSVYVKGETFSSDESWEASYYGKEWTKAGCSSAYCSIKDNPEIFKFEYKEIFPVHIKECNGGVLYDFGKETFAKIYFENLNKEINICYGESEEEALDTQGCYLREYLTLQDKKELPCRAFRYLFIYGAGKEEYNFRVYYEYLPLKMRGNFKCSDIRINKIWQIAEETFHLNSREFFLDGIKRDRWIWSGDAYQSHLINRYVFFDTEISRRTILALRGKEPVEKHINTITDYSFYWIISVYDYYEMTGDKEFLKQIYPKMVSLMKFCISRLDKNGLVSKVEDDWIFIDWADIDKTGAVCAEQMLFLRSIEVMSECADILDFDNTEYKILQTKIKNKIDKFYWNEEKGAYIDSFESGKNNVTRHANIFALLFNYVDEDRKKSIIENVLLNDKIPQIKTPYFKFYELEAMCTIGKLKEVTERMLDYWGGMVDRGATSFWEEYNPEVSGIDMYKMYSDRFGKSLCHAWGSSPIYILGKYYLGVKPTSAGYETFKIEPNLGGLEWFEGTVPINNGNVWIKIKDNIIEVLSDKSGGTLIYNNSEYQLHKNVLLKLACN